MLWKCWLFRCVQTDEQIFCLTKPEKWGKLCFRQSRAEKTPPGCAREFIQRFLSFVYLPELTVESFDCVHGIDPPPHLLWELEIGTEIGLILPPRLGNFWIFLIPTLGKRVQRIQSSLFVCCGIDRLQIRNQGTVQANWNTAPSDALFSMDLPVLRCVKESAIK